MALRDNAEEDPEEDETKKSSAIVLKNDLLGSPQKVTIDSLMPIENRTLSEVPEVEEAVVEPMILTPQEQALKERLWKAQNKDFLKQQREKKKQEKEAKKMERLLQGSVSPTSSHNPLSIQDAESNLVSENKEQAPSVVSDKLSDSAQS